MQRRRLVVAAGLCGAMGRTFAQPAGPERASMPRIGILSFDGAPSGRNPDPLRGFSIGLREHGYVEGQNILIERRYADGRADRLAGLAAELVQLKVDVILAAGPDPREAARQATRTIPIVTTSGVNPVREGWARSLARPGGNVTGLTVSFDELDGKRLELLKQAFPHVVRVAVLLDPVAMGDVKRFTSGHGHQRTAARAADAVHGGARAG